VCACVRVCGVDAWVNACVYAWASISWTQCEIARSTASGIRYLYEPISNDSARNGYNFVFLYTGNSEWSILCFITLGNCVIWVGCLATITCTRGINEKILSWTTNLF